jgi:Amt family ammonium transporter
VHINAGAVAGLVAITPSCSSVSPIGAIFLGAIAGVLCALAVSLKYKFGYDDSLDVVGVHLVGGLWGTIAVGLFLSPDSPAGASGSYASSGLLYGGGVDQLWRQVVGALAVLVTSFVLTYAIGMLLEKTIGFRVSEEDEQTGIDETEHAESGYDLGTLGGSLRGIGVGASSAPRRAESSDGPGSHHDKEVKA